MQTEIRRGIEALFLEAEELEIEANHAPADTAPALFAEVSRLRALGEVLLKTQSGSNVGRVPSSA